MHLVAPLREFSEANADWLTVFQLPTYAPDLNWQEGIWSLVAQDGPVPGRRSSTTAWRTRA